MVGGTSHAQLNVLLLLLPFVRMRMWWWTTWMNCFRTSWRKTPRDPSTVSLTDTEERRYHPFDNENKMLIGREERRGGWRIPSGCWCWRGIVSCDRLILCVLSARCTWTRLCWKRSWSNHLSSTTPTSKKPSALDATRFCFLTRVVRTF